MGMAQRLGAEDNDRDWMHAHAALSRLAKTRALADAEEGRWLLAARRSAAHVHLGFGSFAEYIERLFGYTARSTQEKLRVAEALEELPELTQALESGVLSWSVLRELTRVAVADTEHEWLNVAQGKTVRQLEELVAGKSSGDTPGAAGLATARRYVLRFEVAAETFALFREALGCLRRRSGADLRDDDSLLLAMARQVLGGPADDGRSSYQIALTVCPACGAGQQQASGELVPVGAEVIAMAHCDGQHLGHIPSRAANQNAVVDIDVGASSDTANAHVGVGMQETPNLHGRDASLSTSSTPSETPLSESAPVDARIHAAASRACAARPDPRTRAKQSIPPALRRAVLLRDQHRCQVPGCRNTTFLDLHHIQLRSEGGRHELGNMLTICGCHHRATHRGALLIEKGPDGRVVFRHADGSVYGDVTQPQALDAQAKLFSALRHLGFKEREIRTVLAQSRAEPGLRGASLQDQLREALRRLHPPQPRP
jgi:hypothetical protein